MSLTTCPQSIRNVGPRNDRLLGPDCCAGLVGLELTPALHPGLYGVGHGLRVVRILLVAPPAVARVDEPGEVGGLEHAAVTRVGQAVLDLAHDPAAVLVEH